MSGKAFGAAESSTFCDARSTEVFRSISVPSRLGADLARFQQLVREDLGESHPWVALFDPAAVDEIKRRARCVEIAAALEIYSGAPSKRAKDLAHDWSRYLANDWQREKHLADLPAGTRSLPAALHRLSRLTEGRLLSADTIERDAKKAASDATP